MKKHPTITLLQKQRKHLAPTLYSLEEAVQYADSLLHNVNRTDLKTVLSCYHNTLLNELIKLIKKEKDANHEA